MRGLRWEQVHARRLARSQLIDRARVEVAAVVGMVCGVQAQVLSAAELAIGARVDGITQGDVKTALWEGRSLVKTYGPRGTLHLLPADELPLWMAALRGRAAWRDERWPAAHELETAQARAAIGAIGDALDGRQLSREELASEVAARAGGWARERIASTWADLHIPAAFAGVLCFGPSSGAKVSFVRPDQWLGLETRWDEVDEGEALAEICRRFLRVSGPATSGDFGRWFGLETDETQALFAALRPELEAVEVEGRSAWVLAGDGVFPDEPADSVRLLPQYDCYVLGSHPREAIVFGAARERVFGYGRGRFEGAVGLPVLVIDGVAAGIWERRKRGKRIELRVEPVGDLRRSQREQLEEEAARIGAFLGAEVELTVGTLGE